MFIQKIKSVEIDFKNLGMERLSMTEALEGLGTVYGVNE
jgi:hypothetical protein